MLDNKYTKGVIRISNPEKNKQYNSPKNKDRKTNNITVPRIRTERQTMFKYHKISIL
jgi:hypothetical protein